MSIDVKMAVIDFVKTNGKLPTEFVSYAKFWNGASWITVFASVGVGSYQSIHDPNNHPWSISILDGSVGIGSTIVGGWYGIGANAYYQTMKNYVTVFSQTHPDYVIETNWY